MVDPTTIYSFDNIECNVMSIFDSREGQENLMQWGLDKKERFNFYRFRSHSRVSSVETIHHAKCFFAHASSVASSGRARKPTF